MTEFDPEASGFAKSREAYQTDIRQVMGSIQALQGQIQALEARIVALSGQKPQNQAVEVVMGNSVSGQSQQTLPHSHLLADITNLSSLTITASQVSDLTEAVQDIVGAFITAGSGVSVTYDDGANSLVIAADGSG